MKIVGHTDVRRRLREMKGRVPPSLLFAGPQGIGKKLVAMEFARDLTDETRTIDLTQSLSQTESIFFVSPDGASIKIEQIRDAIHFLSLARDGKPLVLIFDQAHLMNLQAANALLKTLEEPPENCWILLTSPSIKNMLSTIRSRCLVYKSRPLKLQNFTNLSEKVQNQQEILQGRWDWLLKSEEILNSIQEVKAWLARFKAAHLNNSDAEFDYLDWMKGREGLQELIMYLRLLAKAELKQKFSEAAYVKSEKTDLGSLSPLNSGFKSTGWTGLIDNLQKLEIALNSNVDAKLVEDHLLDAIKESHVFH